ncbi:hypothetical protein WBJ53_26035 [Spirosoma sp. SC4-14]|uniref:hypothetical protein n=1 Tax=Spirosoma sp. SC4-14 TaxID=3128900 RepID=UPI0030CFC8AD
MPQHSEDEIASRRATVSNLYRKGWTQMEIADEVGVSQGQISQDLEAIRIEWRNSMLMDFNEKKAEELAKIDYREQILWQAWERSMQPLKKKSTKMKGEVDTGQRYQDKKKNQQVKNLETTETTEERLGDPRYMQGIERCAQQRIELLGLAAPIKVAQTDPEGKAVAARTWRLIDHTGGKPVPAPDDIY